MKSLTKKALSLAMAIAMAGSCMAFASDVTIGDVVDEGTTTVNIPYTTTETDQLTVIVYEVESKTDDALPAIETIGYINQFDAPAMAADATEATGTVTFTMKDDFVDGDVLAEGTYKIIMGGTGVGEAAVAYLVVGEEEVEVTIKGDVNGDNIINIADVTDILNHYLGTAILADEKIADVNGDNIVNIADVTDVLNHYLGTALLQ
jgi:hypothetical protein